MAIRANVYHFLTVIPKGKVVSYKTLGTLFATHPRAIARLMATNQEPDTYPCYKVLADNGGLSGYSGPNGVADKAARLSKDGVLLVQEKADKRFFWQPKLSNVFLGIPLGKDIDSVALEKTLKSLSGEVPVIKNIGKERVFSLAGNGPLDTADFKRAVTEAQEAYDGLKNSVPLMRFYGTVDGKDYPLVDIVW